MQFLAELFGRLTCEEKEEWHHNENDITFSKMQTHLTYYETHWNVTSHALACHQDNCNALFIGQSQNMPGFFSFVESNWNINNTIHCLLHLQWEKPTKHLLCVQFFHNNSVEVLMIFYLNWTIKEHVVNWLPTLSASSSKSYSDYIFHFY